MMRNRERGMDGAKGEGNIKRGKRGAVCIEDDSASLYHIGGGGEDKRGNIKRMTCTESV